MKKILLLLALLPLAEVQAEPLNYDYVYLSSTDTETGGDDERGDTAGAFWSFADTLHVFGSWDDAGSYAGRGENPDWDYKIRTLRLGVGGHYLLGERFMLAPSIALLHADQEVNAPSWTSPHKDSDTGFGAQLDGRFAVANWLELTAGVRYSHVFDSTRSEWVGGLLFHPTNWLALGVLRHEDDDAITATEFTARWYY